MSSRRDVPRYSGPFVLADPVTSADLFARINDGCNCCCCQGNREAAEKLLMQEMKENAQELDLKTDTAHVVGRQSSKT